MADDKKQPYHEVALDVDFEAFAKVVESRRSVRGFDTHVQIPDEVVNRCLDLAMLAPNSSNVQMWRFHWIKGEELRHEVVKACMSQPAAKTAPTLIVATAWTNAFAENAVKLAEELRRQGASAGAIHYHEKMIPEMYATGLLGLKAIMKWFKINWKGRKKPVARGPYGKADVKLAAHKSVALACQNLMLALRAAGYDSCPMEGFDENILRKLLGFTDDESVVMVIGAGKRKPGGVYGKRIRFDRSLAVKERF